MGVHIDLGTWGIQDAGNTFVYVSVRLGWEWVKIEERGVRVERRYLLT